MTTTFTDNRNTALEGADAVGSWTGSASVTLFTSEPTPAESTGCLGMAVSTTTDDAYDGITSDDYSAGGTLSIWLQANGAMDTQVGASGGGIQVQVGDGTNRIGYHTGGSDKAAFRHDDGPVKWECHVLDLANKPANFTAFAGSEASLNEAAITQVGCAFTTLSKAVGNATNCFWDIVRYADIGQDIEMQGGTTSGAAGNGAEAAAVDRAGGNLQAYGVIRELGSGVYGIQGNLTVGNPDSASDQFWEETNVTYSWEDRGLSDANYYRFIIIGSSTATNCEASFTSCTFTVPAAAAASFDGNGADLTVCNIINSTFIGFDKGVETSDDSGDDWTGCAYIACDQVVANGCDISGSSFSEYLGAANTSAVQYNLNVDPNGELDNMTFVKTSGTAHHAIEFGTAIADAADFTLTGCDFGTDFSATEDGSVGDETFHFLDTTGTITLNLSGCTGNAGYRTEGVAVTIVNDPVVTAVTVNDNNAAPLFGARVILEAADATGGLPYLETPVGITRSGTTATADHTGHGIPDGKKVVIRGATDTLYNGVFVISVTDVDTYTYTMNGTPAATASGTITASGVILEGLTDSSGYIADSRTIGIDQPVTGRVSTASGSPFFKDSPLSGIKSAGSGLMLTVQLILDE